MATSRRKAGGRPLKRRVATRQLKRTFVVFCEGVRTEPEYLHAIKREPLIYEKTAVDLRIMEGLGGAVPRTLVSRAIQERARADEESAEIDEFWCVFDVEQPVNHPGLLAAIRDAGQGGINVAVTNPCFELWLILHFQDHARWLDNKDAVRLRRRLDGSGDKGLDPSVYMPSIGDAMRRAVELDKMHEQNDTVLPHNNPSSGMHRLLTAIRTGHQQA